MEKGMLIVPHEAVQAESVKTSTTVCAATQAATRMATNGFISALKSAQRVCARCGGVTGAGRAGVTAEQA